MEQSQQCSITTAAHADIGTRDEGELDCEVEFKGLIGRRKVRFYKGVGFEAEAQL